MRGKRKTKVHFLAAAKQRSHLEHVISEVCPQPQGWHTYAGHVCLGSPDLPHAPAKGQRLVPPSQDITISMVNYE